MRKLHMLHEYTVFLKLKAGFVLQKTDWDPALFVGTSVLYYLISVIMVYKFI